MRENKIKRAKYSIFKYHQSIQPISLAMLFFYSYPLESEKTNNCITKATAKRKERMRK